MENKEITEPKKRVLSRKKSDVAKRRAKESERNRKLKKLAKIKEQEMKAKLPYEYKGKFLPYNRAKKVVKVLQLKSRADYIRWYNEHKPDYLPARPDNSYSKEFEGWIKFLSKPPVSVQTQRMLEEKRIAEERKKREKARDNETKKVKEYIEARVKYDMRMAQNEANRLKRREAIALSHVKKDKKKVEKRLQKPFKENVPKRKVRTVPSKYLPYDEARALIALEKFENIQQYTHWWELNKPSGIPKRPDRVYKNFKWLDYLDKGPYEKFVKKDYRSIYLPYEEARAVVRKLSIENAKQWDDYCKAGKNPNNIPRFPNHVYQYRKDDPDWGKWYSWEDWLGNINDRIEAIKEQQRVMMIVMPTGAPQGVYSFIYRNDTEKGIDKFIDDNELYVIRMYKVDIFDWTGYLHRRFKLYMDSTNTFEVPNINQVLFDLDNLMERIL